MARALFNIAYTLPTPPSYLRGNKRAEYLARRKFYNLTSDYNYFSYALNNQKVVKNANAEHYFTRENTNSGLFNFDGAMDEEQKSQLKAKLQDSKSIIWHGFISFDEDTSKGFNTQENAIRFMKQTFGGFLERAGFKKDNIEPYFALHDDTDHRHIHFAFIEKEPKRRDKNGVLGYRRLGNIDAKAIDNYMVSANMYVSEHHDEYYTARDEAIDSLKSIRNQGDLQGNIEKNQDLNIALKHLIERLPKQGRLGYHSENMRDLRPEIDKVTEMLIATDSRAIAAHKNVLDRLAAVKQETIQLVKENKLLYNNDRRLSKEEISRVMGGDIDNTKVVNIKNIDYFERLEESYRGKIGNITIGICKELKTKGVEQFRRVKVNDKHLKIEAKYRRKRRDNAVAGAIRALCSTSAAYVRTNFMHTVQQNEKEIEQERRYGKVI